MERLGRRKEEREGEEEGKEEPSEGGEEPYEGVEESRGEDEPVEILPERVTIRPGDVVFTPNPTYPIHPYSVIIAGGDLRSIPIGPDRDFFDDLLYCKVQ